VKKIFFKIIGFNLCMTAVFAQDPHFSQYGNLPLYLNPAHSGNGIEHMRATIVYRNQWASVANPFTTQGFLIDKKVNRLGFGFQIIKNGAGAESIKQLNLSGTLGYNMPVSKESVLSGGFQVGMINKNFNPANLSFDNQYVDDVGFDPNISNGEVFTNTSITRPDLSAGLMYQRGYGNRKIKFKPFGGISFAHINRPRETFIIDDNRMPVRKTFHAGAGVVLKENIELRPMAVMMLQQHFNEMYVGSMVSFLMKNYNKFQTGLYFRNKDAAIVYAGYQVNQLFIGTSYDFNISSLKEVSRSQGGFEITLSYIPKARKKGKPTDPAEIIAKKKPSKPKKIAKAEMKELGPVRNNIQLPEKLESINRLPLEKREEKSLATVTKKINPAPEQKPAVVELKKELPAQKTEELISPAVAVNTGALKQADKKAPEKISRPFERKIISPAVNVNPEKEQAAITKIESKPTEKISQPPVPEPPAKQKPFYSWEQPKETGAKAESKNPEIIIPEKPAVHEIKSKPKQSHDFASAEKPMPVISKMTDTDGDGIMDSEDECPYIKGTMKMRGCPDSDDDGIPDLKDRCPMEPGTLKNNGCPETKLSLDKSKLLKNFNNIEFETGRAIVKTTDVYDIIEFAIDIMYANPSSRIILTGHTDSEGDDLYNMNLSARRTDVVKRYMELHGISPSRIEAVNYGETMPLLDNTTDSGKARNRRVEINIIRN